MSGNVDNGLCGAKLSCDGEVPSVCGHDVHAAAAAAAETFATQQIKVVKQKASGKELDVPQFSDDSDDAAWSGIFKWVKHCIIHAAEGTTLAKDFLVACAKQMDKTSGLKHAVAAAKASGAGSSGSASGGGSNAAQGSSQCGISVDGHDGLDGITVN